MKRFVSWVALGAIACGATAPSMSARAQQPAPTPKEAPQDPHATPAAPAAPGGKRTMEQVQAELGEASTALRAALASPEVMLDPAKRAEAAPKCVPALKRMIGLFDELSALDPESKKDLASGKIEFL